MKKPVSIFQIIGLVFFIVGPLFLISGYLNYINILQISSNSKGNPIHVFPIVGAILLFIGIVFLYIPYRRIHKRCKLKSDGIKVVGVVTSVRELTSVQCGKDSPFLVEFNYDLEGKTYHGRSHWFWVRIPVTSSMGALGNMVADKERKILKDFKVPRFTLQNIQLLQ